MVNLPLPSNAGDFHSPTPVQYTVTAEADSGLNITPAGSQIVPQGGSAAFVYSAKPGYSISGVIVDGLSVLIRGSYTFIDV
jgi:hypothetical protein